MSKRFLYCIKAVLGMGLPVILCTPRRLLGPQGGESDERGSPEGIEERLNNLIDQLKSSISSNQREEAKEQFEKIRKLMRDELTPQTQLYEKFRQTREDLKGQMQSKGWL